MKTKFLFLALCGFTRVSFAAIPDDGSVLPFPPAPTARVAGPTLQESVHKRRVEPERLPKGAPNVLIVLIDDAGFSVPDTFGGFAHTPALTKLRDEGISFNRFHTTSICSPAKPHSGSRAL
jgi:arylsulfatase